MDRRHVAAAALALLVAGCSGLAPADGGETAATETLTPAPVSDPGATPTPTPGPAEGLPPGVNASGVVDTGRLLAAHEAALANRSYAWTVEYNRTDLNEGRVEQAYRKRVVVDDGAYLVDTDRAAGRVDRTTYVDDTGGYAEVVLNGRPNYRAVDYPRGPGYHVTVSSFVELYLAGGASDVRFVEHGDREYVRLHVTDPPAGLLGTHPKSSVHNFTATAFVAPSGFVRAAAVDYEFDLGRDRLAVSTRFDYEDVGEATLERPAWVDNVTGAPPADGGNETVTNVSVATNGTLVPNETAPKETTPSNESTAAGTTAPTAGASPVGGR